MMDINSFGILGGEKREAAVAEYLAADGCTVYARGLDRLPLSEDVRRSRLEEIVSRCMTIILPLPVTVDGKTLNAPYSGETLALDDSFAGLMQHKEEYGGRMAKLFATSSLWDTAEAYDYYTREEFAVRNAGVTAEAAVAIAVREYEGSLIGGRCLVAGYGRIGRALASLLRGMGAQVTVSARRPRDMAWIEISGCRAVQTEKLGEGEEPYDVVFNTIPALVFPKRVLSRLKPGCLVIDLASAPGGVDFAAAEKLGIRTVHALSLPGKVSPRAAGEIIKQTIYNMMEE